MFLLLLAACPSGGRVAAAPGTQPDTAVSPPDTAPADSAPPPDDTATPPGPTASCGDATCDTSETCWDCAADCGACDCPTPVEVILYTQSAWTVLADALDADPSPCADYWISLPAPAEHKQDPRGGGEPEGIRARSPRLHALAEFHWSTWAAASGSWYDKGVDFRRRMAEAGYDVSAGDTWAINELPSSVRTEAATRADVVELLRGLYEGSAEDPDVTGVVFVVGMGHTTENFSVYTPALEDWLEDADFWAQANLHVSHWAQEVYADPDATCVVGATAAEVSTSLNHFVEHVAWHAEVGPDTANTAQSYLGRAYTPLMNAVWQADAGYGDTDVPLETMEHFVSHEVYAARAWSEAHNHPDGRLGFAWARSDGVVDSDLAVLAARLASAVHHAYDAGGGSAAGACSPSGAYTWCACEVEGAAFNTGWDSFGSW